MDHAYGSSANVCEEEEEEVFCGEEDVGGRNRNEAELIRLVSQNPILYNKKTDGYMNARYNLILLFIGPFQTQLNVLKHLLPPRCRWPRSSALPLRSLLRLRLYSLLPL